MLVIHSDCKIYCTNCDIDVIYNDIHAKLKGTPEYLDSAIMLSDINVDANGIEYIPLFIQGSIRPRTIFNRLECTIPANAVTIRMKPILGDTLPWLDDFLRDFSRSFVRIEYDIRKAVYRVMWSPESKEFETMQAMLKSLLPVLQDAPGEGAAWRQAIANIEAYLAEYDQRLACKRVVAHLSKLVASHEECFTHDRFNSELQQQLKDIVDGIPEFKSPSLCNSLSNPSERINYIKLPRIYDALEQLAYAQTTHTADLCFQIVKRMGRVRGFTKDTSADDFVADLIGCKPIAGQPSYICSSAGLSEYHFWAMTTNNPHADLRVLQAALRRLNELHRQIQECRTGPIGAVDCQEIDKDCTVNSVAVYSRTIQYNYTLDKIEKAVNRCLHENLGDSVTHTSAFN